MLQFDWWYHPNGIASIISQAHAVDHPDYEVDYVKASQKGAKDDHCIWMNDLKSRAMARLGLGGPALSDAGFRAGLNQLAAGFRASA